MASFNQARKGSKRDLALERIRIDVLRHGKLTDEGMRVYVENRISKEKLDEVVSLALKQRESKFYKQKLKEEGY